MATDQSPPKNRLITICAILTVITLVALKFVFDSFFVRSMEGEVAFKVLDAPAVQRKKMEAEQEEKFRTAKVSIEKAKNLLANHGRDAFSATRTVSSTDKAALDGWTSPVPPTDGQ